MLSAQTLGNSVETPERSLLWSWHLWLDLSKPASRIIFSQKGEHIGPCLFSYKCGVTVGWEEWKVYRVIWVSAWRSSLWLPETWAATAHSAQGASRSANIAWSETETTFTNSPVLQCMRVQTVQRHHWFLLSISEHFIYRRELKS